MRKLKFIGDKLRQSKSKKADSCRCLFYHWNFKEILMIKHSSMYHWLTIYLHPITEIYIALYDCEWCDHISESVGFSDVLPTLNQILLS